MTPKPAASSHQRIGQSITLVKSRLARPLYLVPTLFFIGLAVLVYARSLLLTQDGAFNPDEADLWLAAGKSSENPVPFAEYAGSTYGPLWPLLLGLLPRSDFWSPWLVLHLTAIILLAAILAIWAGILVRFSGLQLALGSWLVLILVLAVGGLQKANSDFFGLSTELLPLLILAIAWALIFVPSQPGKWHLITASFLAGLAPMAKIQIVPLVLVTLVVIVLELKKITKVSLVGRVLIAAGLAALPQLILLLVAIVTARVSFWLVEYATLSFTYSFTTATQRTATSVLERINLGIQLIGQHPALSILILTLVAICWKTLRTPGTRRRFGLALLSLGAGFMCVAIPGTGFSHYMYFWIAATVIAIAVVSPVEAAPVAVSIDARAAITATCLFVVFVSVPLALFRPVVGIPSLRVTVATVNEMNRNLLAGISANCPANSPVVIWGWQPELLVETRRLPATRFMINDIHPDRLTSWHKRVLADIRSSLARPEVQCFVDSGGDRALLVSDVELRKLGYNKMASFPDETAVWSK